MEFKIGDPVKSPDTPKDAFVITCSAMFGDGDGGKKIDMGLFPNTPEYLPYLQEAVEVCERMLAKYPCGKSGMDSYEGVEGGDRWFKFHGSDYIDEPDVPEIYRDITLCNEIEGWPNDPFTDYTYHSYFQGYKVRYFDASGIEHHVKVIK